MGNYSEYDDQELISLLKDDNHAAFTEIYRRYINYSYRAAYNVLRDEDICMDIVQDVFVWLWQKRSVIEIPNLKAYLYTAVKYRMLNVIRDGRFREEVLNNFGNSETQLSTEQSYLELKELKAFIEQVAETLPETARKIFRMSRNEQLSHREIAERLGISEKTVRNQINISLKKLRTSIARFVCLFFF
ncbi:RNA polymerase sigma-70 factor [Pararcticibacter amylolyticus]|uniref:RNA polymerase sigma-70 factor n=1 Tax=Pararcticibacter amylolyticus TaxID=2173175 RepID=A0A2U2PL10_9SPHI|nr:RNA polymerase sigma-70 factor [Pararcticibacter amylolyticus]PWG81964.1 RNA polymerase sigma-70 factor [Pararcticibacter amylolyticus]